jgi:hypothetical protein
MLSRTWKKLEVEWQSKVLTNVTPSCNLLCAIPLVVNGRAEPVRGTEFLLRCRIATSISSEIIGMFDSQLRYEEILNEDFFACRSIPQVLNVAGIPRIDRFISNRTSNTAAMAFSSS